MGIQFDEGFSVPDRKKYVAEMDILLQIPPGRSYLFKGHLRLYRALRAKIAKINVAERRQIFTTKTEGLALRVGRLR